MQRWRGQDEIPTDWGRCVVTIGVFDGVHRGHAELINHAVKAGRSRGVPTVLMTFDPHPMEVVFPGSHPAQLTTLTRRAELVEELGIDVFLVMPFTSDFMKLTPERYIHELLVERLHVVEVVVGENFTFGKKAAGNVDMLRKAGERFGFAVEGMSLVGRAPPATRRSRSRRPTSGPAWTPATSWPPPRRWAGRTASRAWWCAATAAARCWASRPPTSRRRCTRRFPPTACTRRGSPCWATARSMGTVVPGERYQAAVSVGTNPTFSGRTRTVEAFVLDTAADLYGQHVAVDFVARIRGQEKFDSVDDLVKAMGGDTERARTILAAQ